MSLKGRVVNAILAAEAPTPLGLVAALGQDPPFKSVLSRSSLSRTAVTGYSCAGGSDARISAISRIRARTAAWSSCAST